MFRPSVDSPSSSVPTSTPHPMSGYRVHHLEDRPKLFQNTGSTHSRSYACGPTCGFRIPRGFGREQQRGSTPQTSRRCTALLNPTRTLEWNHKNAKDVGHQSIRNCVMTFLSGGKPAENCLGRTCLKWASDGSLSEFDKDDLMRRLCATDSELAKSDTCRILNEPRTT
jgi:hypothetical protein